jgi:pimeloyl-ACP methyl ester carboxylesterase
MRSRERYVVDLRADSYSPSVSTRNVVSIAGHRQGGNAMTTVRTNDGIEIFFKEWGPRDAQPLIWNWWRQGMMGGAKAHYDGIVAFSQTDFTEDLKKISIPVLVMHGDDDQIVPYADAGPLSAKLLKKGMLKTYKGFPHGMPTTQAPTVNADLLAFIKG